jgi:glycosyltransferase involved in cell wall biosynthesis
MRILTSSHYIARFTVPPQPEHSVARVRFVNMGRLWSPALAVAAWPPSRPFDLAHFINQIPLHLGKPWLVTFESALPRMFPPREPLHLHLRHQLCRPQCLSIVAMSAWAMANFKRLNAGWSGLKEALRKSLILAPALAPQTASPRTLDPGQTIHVVFVGNNFSRKGGIVALRLAKMALAERLRLQIHLVSTKMIVSGSHTDHPVAQRYDEDLKALALPNVTFHGAKNNQQVQELMKQCHLTLLATLHDTYGFSVLEGFSHGLPAITSDVCALPEFVSGSSSTMANGHLLHLPKDGRGCWLHEPDAISSDYWEMLDQAFSSMALQTFLFLESLARNPGRLEELSRNAIKTLEQRHSQYSLARALEVIYSKAKYCGLSQSGQLAGNQTAAK